MILAHRRQRVRPFADRNLRVHVHVVSLALFHLSRSDSRSLVQICPFLYVCFVDQDRRQAVDTRPTYTQSSHLLPDLQRNYLQSITWWFWKSIDLPTVLSFPPIFFCIFSNQLHFAWSVLNLQEEVFSNQFCNYFTNNFKLFLRAALKNNKTVSTDLIWNMGSKRA